MGRHQTSTDYLIVGAGCAGLSLAVHLLRDGPPSRRVLLVDPRTEFGRDRTWCMWRTRRHPFECCVTHRWNRWAVVAPGGRRVVRGSSRHPYEHIPARAFYSEALRHIDASERVTLRCGVTVESLRDLGDGVVADTTAGPITARLAFDGRPPASLDASPPPGHVRWLQHFGGWEVETDGPRFDPSTVELMDFDVPQEGCVHFRYVLPFAVDRALIEDTWFSASPHDPAVYEDHLRRSLARRMGETDYRIVAREQGALPMYTDPPRPRASHRIYRLGLAAGAAKPSTGYAFPFIQRHCAILARALRDAEPCATPTVRPSLAHGLDHVFLSWLDRETDRAPETFVRLFERAPADSVARFLSETATAADHGRVMAALPPGPLMWEMLRVRARAVRRRLRA